MSDPTSHSLGWGQQATPLVPDGTVHITTRPALSDKASQSVYVQSKQSFAYQLHAALQWEEPPTELDLPQLAPANTISASHHIADSEETAGSPNTELQHMSTSDLQEFCTQQFGEAAAESVVAAEQEAPGLTRTFSISPWQQGSGMVIDDAGAALQDLADIASISHPDHLHSSAAFDSNQIMSEGFVPFAPAELMEQSLSMFENVEREASLHLQMPNIGHP